MADPSKQNTVPLDPYATRDIIMIWENFPSIKIAFDAIVGLTFSDPFTVVVQRLGWVGSPILELLIVKYYIPWQKQVLAWVYMFGACPWIKVYDSDIEEDIPVVPPLGSGYISTGINEKHQQIFEWRYLASTSVKPNFKGNTEPEKHVEWVISDHPPTIYGQYTSLVSTLLQDYQTLQMLREAVIGANQQGLHRPVILEYNPGKVDPISDAVIAVGDYGERAAGAMLEQVTTMKEKTVKIKVSALVDALAEKQRLNLSRQTNHIAETSAANVYGLSGDAELKMMNARAAGLADRTYPLSPYFKVAQAPPPLIFGKFEEFHKQFEIRCALVIGYSLDLAHNTSSGKSDATQKGNLRFVNDRVQAIVDQFTFYTAHAFYVCNKKELQAEFDAISTHSRRRGHKKLEALLVEKDIKIIINRRPLMEPGQEMQMHGYGIMRKEDAAKITMRSAGLPESMIHITDKPDRTAPELLPEVADSVIPPKKKKKPI